MRLGRFGSRGAALAATCMALAAATASGQVVINQAMGQDGNGSGVPNQDYVELFNRGNTPVDLTGWSVQVCPQLHTTHPWIMIPLTSTVLQPGQYYLVQVGSLPLVGVTPDAFGTDPRSTNLFGNRGGVLLMDNTNLVTAECPLGDPGIIDHVGFGSGILTSCYDGAGPAPEPPTSGMVAIHRKMNGCQDTNNNAADFQLGFPTPRNTLFERPFGLRTNINTVPALPGTTITFTAFGHDHACGAGNAALTSATVDLTAVGGSGSHAMRDDGVAPDVTAGDNVWTASYTIPGGTAIGTYPAVFTLTGPAGSITGSGSVIVANPGDFCQNAKTIMSLPFTDNIVGTDYTADPFIIPCRSVLTPTNSPNGWWYSITPATDMVVKVSKSNLLYNLSLHTGSCGATTIIDCDDSNIGANFRLQAGTNYKIFAFYDNSSGTPPAAAITFTQITAPVADLCENAINLNTAGLPSITFNDANGAQFLDATGDIDNTCDVSPVVTRRGIWYSFTPATDTILRAAETGTNIFSTSVWTGACSSLTQHACSSSETVSYHLPAGQTYYILVGLNSTAQPGASVTYNMTFSASVPPPNDVCSGAEDLGSLAIPTARFPVLSSGSLDSTTCGNAAFGLWYTFTASVKGALRLNESSSVDVLWAVVDDCTGTTSLLCTGTDTSQFVDMVPSQTVKILLYTSSTAATATNVEFSFIPQLANDVCSGAEDLNSFSFPYITQADARGSTDHDMDIGPCTTMNSSAYALWYKYTPTQNGRLAVSDSNSTDNVDIGVWPVSNAADPCNSMGTQIGCIANSSDSGIFDVTAGTTYLILLGGQPGTGGPTRPTAPYALTFDLLQPPPNDDCGGATVISFLPFQENVDSFVLNHDPRIDGTDNGGTGLCLVTAAGEHFNTVWYAYTPATDEAITIWDTSTTKSLSIGLFDGCGSGHGGTLLSCGTNDVTFNVDAGQLYLIRVGNNLSTPETQTGIYRLNFVRSQRITNDVCTGAYAVTTVPYSAIIDASAATADGPTAVQTGCNTGSPAAMSQSVWYKISTQTPGFLSGSIEVDYGRANSGVAALFRSLDGTCNSIDTTPIWCSTDPSTPVSATMMIGASLDASTTYFLLIGLPGTTSSPDFVLSIDNIDYSGILDSGASFCCRGTTCQAVPSGTCTGTVAGSASVPVTSCTGNTFAGCCFGDYDHNGTKDITDIFTFLNAWFSASTYADITSNGAATPDITDIFTFLNAWFGTCS